MMHNKIEVPLPNGSILVAQCAPHENAPYKYDMDIYVVNTEGKYVQDVVNIMMNPSKYTDKIFVSVLRNPYGLLENRESYLIPLRGEVMDIEEMERLFEEETACEGI